MKKKLTSKEWLAIAMSVFYALIVFVAGLGMDARHIVFGKRNLFEGIAELLQIPKMSGYAGVMIMLLFVSVFFVVFPITAIAIKRSLQAHGESIKSAKAWILYVSSFLASMVLAVGLGTVFQIPNDGLSKYGVCLEYVFGAVLVGSLVYLVLVGFVYAVVGIVYYLFLNKKSPLKTIDEDRDEEEEKKLTYDRNDLSSSFSGVDGGQVNVLSQAGGIANTTATNTGVLGNRVLGPKNEVFKNLVAIDEDTTLITTNDLVNEDLNLQSLLEGLQGYLAKKEHLYYDKRELADFIAGMSASKLIILEGISGTGKSSLPRYVAKYIGEEAYFEPVQVTYKEKSDLLGFYNELTGKYNETPFLKKLYRATYENNKINMMVLDEMNISRVEYYFADFLSVMEFPEDERNINLMVLPDDYDAPTNLPKGNLLITPNTYFIGTANKDDSTFTITDKVIDRAIVINFSDNQKELHLEDKEYDPISLSYNELNDLFVKARNEHPYKEEEKYKFLSLIEFIKQELGIATGNRILKQIEDMVPIYLAMGMNETDCYDNILANKILRKLEAKFDQGLSNQLQKLVKKLDELYGEGNFKASHETIEKYLRRLM